MPDYGQRMSNKALKTVDRRIRQTYSRAEKELNAKLSKFFSRFMSKSVEMIKKRDEGKITKEQYQSWLTGQVFQRDRLKERIREANVILFEHNKEAVSLINDKMFNVFAENYNGFAKAATGVTGINFHLYDEHTVARLIKDKPKLLPLWKIDEKKDYIWSSQRVQTAIKQGIIQGESVDDITKRLCKSLSAQSESRMRLFARTAVTEAENAGRLEMLKDAEKMGIKVKKKWLATNDNRTRDSHAEMDGEEVDVDEEFSNGLMYPGDPNGDPSEVYNCRCTMVYVYPDYE